MEKFVYGGPEEYVKGCRGFALSNVIFIGRWWWFQYVRVMRVGQGASLVFKSHFLYSGFFS